MEQFQVEIAPETQRKVLIFPHGTVTTLLSVIWAPQWRLCERLSPKRPPSRALLASYVPKNAFLSSENFSRPRARSQHSRKRARPAPPPPASLLWSVVPGRVSPTAPECGTGGSQGERASAHWGLAEAARAHSGVHTWDPGPAFLAAGSGLAMGRHPGNVDFFDFGRFRGPIFFSPGRIFFSPKDRANFFSPAGIFFLP